MYPFKLKRKAHEDLLLLEIAAKAASRAIDKVQVDMDKSKKQQLPTISEEKVISNETTSHLMPKGDDGKTNNGTALKDKRKERQLLIQDCMTLLRHSVSCEQSECKSPSCPKMKSLLKHPASCHVGAKGGCLVCKRLKALLQIHIFHCTDKECKVPGCEHIKKQRATEVRMAMLGHSLTCGDCRCTFASCQDMKILLNHRDSCQVKSIGGCNMCIHVEKLMRFHMHRCMAHNCPICTAIRARF